MTMTTQQHLSDDQATQIVEDLATGYGNLLRSPVLRTPADYGMEYEALTFPSLDGTPLEAWFMPCEGSTKLVIANHPLWFNRSGLPAHVEPWRSLGALGGNDFEVDFLPDYRILHDAGYHVLAYDERNHGQSAAANGGIGSGGRFESRDVLGSLHFARHDERTAGLTIGLFSRCQGANATFYAMQEHPKEFADVRCVLAPQPLSVGVAMQRLLALLGIPERIDELERAIQLQVGFTFDQMTPTVWARSVSVPAYLYQVRDDVMTTPDDVQAIYDAIPAAGKVLEWIEGTTHRWDGYLDFQRNPSAKLAFLAEHLA